MNMMDFFTHLSPVWQALIATTFTWLVTALGAATVFFFKQVNRKLLDGMLGFAAGVMIAASYWSLLAPAIEMTRETNDAPVWLPGGGRIFTWRCVHPHDRPVPSASSHRVPGRRGGGRSHKMEEKYSARLSDHSP
jgi:zinc transporter ZupT